ncbi:hypothetical protein BMF94_1743 [Rhodotorula taiwanensis]|uniref:General negative regulator of transcription subunit n=1 Tax=Rhodotorula taiwanensis TaxID=741276 RepID=A0A2S5BEE2_9BASI|nr:hypothetical protein BMF94_1743 [Rhodotorula taiwanensis]
MAARKLQTEIDKTLKKVQEGVEVFEGIFEKIQASSNQTQKEKLESDLKTQIKKLQRLRDQIKTWMTSNDIKDKQPLVDHRKLIETQMERFKACEKEMKTKAFSKEGLNAAAKLDPKEQQKLEMCQWIQTMVEELSRQVEQAEAEVEQIQSVRQKKKDAEREQRLEELEHLNERRAWHINRLELILRLLENGNLQTDAVTNVKEDIAYFVESNTEEDFEEDEGIYDELNLEDEEDMFQIGQDDHHSSHDSQSVADSEPAPPVPPIPKTPAKKTTAPPPPADEDSKPAASTRATPAKATPQKKASLDSTSSARVPASSSSSSHAAAATTTPLRSVSGPASSHPAPRTTPAPALPPIRYAAAAAAANASSSPSVATASVPTPASSAPAPASVASPALPPPGLSAPGPAAEKDASLSPAPATVATEPSPTPSPAPTQTAAPSSASPAPSSAPDAQQSSQASSGQQQQQPSATKADSRLPSSLADLVTSFESAKQKSLRREQDLDTVNQVLDAGLVNIPQPLDAEKPNHYVPRNPYATPSYYPQEPSSQFASPALFAKLDVDTLFYIFYYRPGTYLQYLAANELKKQSWRFHKQYLTWFQRANEPTTITDSYEQGVYLYFDWEAGWCQRRKHDFSFSYAYLEQ